MKTVFREAGVIDMSLDAASLKVYESSNVCAANGRPHHRKAYLSAM